MSEFTIADHAYRADKMPPMSQFDILCRMAAILKVAPEIVPLLPLLKRIRDSGAGRATTEAVEEGAEPVPTPMLGPEDVARAVVPLADAIAAMSDKDRHFVLGTCLSFARRKDDTAWAPIWNKDANRALYNDIELPEMLQIAAQVAKTNFARFFGVTP